MTFKEIETTWKEERELLDKRLYLNAIELETTITQNRWKYLKGVVRYHRFGIAMSFVYAGLMLYWMVVKVGYDNWWASIPLYIGAIIMAANGTFVPLKAPPLKHLEKYTVAELHGRIILFRKTAVWRFPIDLATVGICLLCFYLSSLSFLYGIDWWNNPQSIPIHPTVTYLGLFAFAVVGCYVTLKRQLGRISELEAELSDFSGNELVS